MSLGGRPKSDAVDEAVRAADGQNIFAISAIDKNGCLASFSNFGDLINFAAPGVGVISTKKGGGTTTFSGTSMASPHVAGLLLLDKLGSKGTACDDPGGTPDPIAHN